MSSDDGTQELVTCLFSLIIIPIIILFYYDLFIVFMYAYSYLTLYCCCIFVLTSRGIVQRSRHHMYLKARIKKCSNKLPLSPGPATVPYPNPCPAPAPDPVPYTCPLPTPDPVHVPCHCCLSLNLSPTPVPVTYPYPWHIPYPCPRLWSQLDSIIATWNMVYDGTMDVCVHLGHGICIKWVCCSIITASFKYCDLKHVL